MATAWQLIPGVPAAGHLSSGGYWHPGATDGCVKCEPTPSFTCPDCGARSYNRNDVREQYCGRCHDWTGDEKLRTARRAR